MGARPDDPWNDALVERLVRFDEELRLGHEPASGAGDVALAQVQGFLVQLQSIWPRSVKKIGAYLVVRSLGQGVIGPSYLVEDPASRQPLVLKILWPDLSAHPETRQQFVRDAQQARELRHAGILAVREVLDSGQLAMVVSEFCPGQSLAQWRRSKPQPIAWNVATAFIVQLADILAFAHAAGISHGNLKPSNVFFSSVEDIVVSNLDRAMPRIGDFALAKAVQETSLPSQRDVAWPAPQFLAPEQLEHRTKPAVPAADVYALGVIWYELLTGRYPVKGTTRAEVAADLQQAAAPPPRQYRPEAPAAIESLVLQCLERRPSNRPASRQLCDALREMLTPDSRQAWWKRWLGLK
jgi:serine/threonine-protein kinase